jgi:hypothetical protein
MNIFVLDENPQICASFHCDKHVCKMIVETAQMLCTAHHMLQPVDDIPYKKTHVNHPANVWIRHSYENYTWLLNLGVALLDEYTKRYNRVHKTTNVIRWLIKHKLSKDVFHIHKRTPFVLCMPDEYKTNDAVASYRNFYIGAKSSFAKWKCGNVPEWFGELKC